MRVATWNLNTWINRKNKRSNDELWQWAEENLKADLVIFTEAEIPPPKSISANGWNSVFKKGGIPNRSNWGTIIAGRNLRVELITHVGRNQEYALDSFFPGSFTAADVWSGQDYFATVIGLYLPYRKDENKEFIGHPENDLTAMAADFVALTTDRNSSLIVAGDFNTSYDEVPHILKKSVSRKFALSNPFENVAFNTFKQDWDEDGLYEVDYLYISKDLKKRLTSKKGGDKDFSNAFEVSDHAPLLIELT